MWGVRGRDKYVAVKRERAVRIEQKAVWVNRQFGGLEGEIKNGDNRESKRDLCVVNT
jgi:hypothetical protein